MIRFDGGYFCLVKAHCVVLKGRVQDMSFSGVSVLLKEAPSGSLVGSLLELHGITLKVIPVSMVRRRRYTLVRFKVDSIEAGEERWRALHHARWQASRPRT